MQCKAQAQRTTKRGVFRIGDAIPRGEEVFDYLESSFCVVFIRETLFHHNLDHPGDGLLAGFDTGSEKDGACFDVCIPERMFQSCQGPTEHIWPPWGSRPFRKSYAPVRKSHAPARVCSSLKKQGCHLSHVLLGNPRNKLMAADKRSSEAQCGEEPAPWIASIHGDLVDLGAVLQEGSGTGRHCRTTSQARVERAGTGLITAHAVGQKRNFVKSPIVERGVVGAIAVGVSKDGGERRDPISVRQIDWGSVLDQFSDNPVQAVDEVQE